MSAQRRAGASRRRASENTEASWSTAGTSERSVASSNGTPAAAARPVALRNRATPGVSAPAPRRAPARASGATFDGPLVPYPNSALNRCFAGRAGPATAAAAAGPNMHGCAAELEPSRRAPPPDTRCGCSAGGAARARGRWRAPGEQRGGRGQVGGPGLRAHARHRPLQAAQRHWDRVRHRPAGAAAGSGTGARGETRSHAAHWAREQSLVWQIQLRVQAVQGAPGGSAAQPPRERRVFVSESATGLSGARARAARRAGGRARSAAAHLLLKDSSTLLALGGAAVAPMSRCSSAPLEWPTP